jgi:Sigma-70 region 2
MSLDFNNLKLTPLSEMNLSGGSIQTVLDALIYGALENIVVHSTAFDPQLVYILGRSAFNSKRKHSALEKPKFISILTRYCVTEDRREKFRLLENAKIERMFLFGFLSLWLDTVKGYESFYFQHLTLKGKKYQEAVNGLEKIESEVGMGREHLFQTIVRAKQFKIQAEEFRNAIVAKYLKHAWKEAKKFVDLNKSHSYSFDDLYQNFIGAVSHAIDRYDSSKGALTSYINFWILREKTSGTFHFENGVAYSVPQGVKAQMAKGSYSDQNFSVSLDSPMGDEGSTLGEILPDTSLNQEQNLLASQELDRIKRLAKYADPLGLARLYLDIDERFSPKEIAKASAGMFEQGVPQRGPIQPYN